MFDIILADPPWTFTTRSPKGGGRSPDYPTMTLAELQALDVGSLAADDCALFLWCVWPSLFRDVPGLLAAWGFDYRTLAFIWIKTTRRSNGLHMGLGYYTRANSEPCLLAIRGRMPVAAHDVHQVIYSPVQEHSRKPDEVYSRIQRLYPGRRYVELFARRPWPGWAAWGNQVESDHQVESALATQGRC